MSHLKWNPTALDDLQRIAEFIREHSPTKEQAFISKFISQTSQLETQPRSGQKREIKPDGTEIRSLLIGKHHRIIYAVSPDDAVRILQVFDLRSDQDFHR